MNITTDARAFAASRGLPDPVRAYQKQRDNAAHRGVAWEFEFSQWWDIWRDWYHMRGRGKNHLCMARESDSGPYSVENVYLRKVCITRFWSTDLSLPARCQCANLLGR